MVDPRMNEMAERADIWLRIKPGSDSLWASAMSRYMFEHGYADEAFPAEKSIRLKRIAPRWTRLLCTTPANIPG